MVSFPKRHQYHQIGTPPPNGQSRHHRLPLVLLIPLLLSEASLPPLRVTLTHFTLLFCERALRLQTSFLISGLGRLGEKPRLCRLSWRAFASTHPLMLLLVLGRLFLLALPVLLGICLPSRWSPPLPLHALVLISLSLAKVPLSPTLTLSPLMIWCCGQRLCSFSFWQRRLPHTCHLLSRWH